MPVVLHLVDGRGVVDRGTVAADVLALNGREGVTHVVDVVSSASPSSRLPDLARGALAAVADGAALARRLRELAVRHGDIAVHAHGPAAWRAAVVVAERVIVDAADEVPAHRLLPLPIRRVYFTYEELDVALEEGGDGRRVDIVPPGIDARAAPTSDGRPEPTDVDVIAVHGIDAAADLVLARVGRVGRVAANDVAVRGPPLVAGRKTVLCPAVARALTGGRAMVVVDPQGRALSATVALSSVRHLNDVADLPDALDWAAGVRPRARRLPTSLGRHARTDALADLYATALGVVPTRRPPGRRRR